MALMNFGLDSEYAELTSVLLYKPEPAIAAHPDPSAVQHLAPINHEELTRQLDRLIETFTFLGIHVTLVDPPEETSDTSNYNMMFCRDTFFMTPKGAVLANMANETRRGEVSHAARTFAKAGIPVLHTVDGDGRFEGADALWVNKGLVAVGVGNRTNMPAFMQLQTVLRKQGIDSVPLPSTQRATQHLLGSLQFVDRDMALVREGIISPQTLTLLEKHDFRIVRIPESIEVRNRQAMNIVTVAPGKVIMTAGCPETREKYLDAGIEVIAELPISQLINGAGGLACTTGTLARKSG
jgi:N-dimethylarginine dimethylaminohydrolase